MAAVRLSLDSPVRLQDRCYHVQSVRYLRACSDPSTSHHLTGSWIVRTYPLNIAAEFARALSTNMVTTRSRASRRPDDTAFKKISHRLGLRADTRAAFEYITNIDRHGDSYAIGIIQALHADSNGPDFEHAPAYEAPGLSPAAAWRGGPHGNATIIELASNPVSYTHLTLPTKA